MTTSAILDDTVAVRCACSCGAEWEAEMPLVMFRMLSREGDRLPSECDSCLQKRTAGMFRSIAAPSCNRPDPWETICPELHRLTTEGGKTDRDRLKAAHGTSTGGVEMTSRAIWELWNHPGPVVLAGLPGSMKTRLAWRMVRKAWETGPVEAFTAWTFQSQLKDAGGSFTEAAFMRRMTEARIVFVDDIGKADWTSNTHGAFFELLDARARHGRCLLMTTNDDRRDWVSTREDHKGAAARSTAQGIMRRIDQFAKTVIMKPV